MDAKPTFVQVKAEIARNIREIAVHAASMDDTVSRTRVLITQSRDLITYIDRQLLEDRGPQADPKHRE